MNTAHSADKFSSSPLAQTIFQRYAFSEQEITAGAALCHISRNQFIEELALSIGDPSRREAALFMPYSIDLLVDYLYKSHRYYLDKLLPEIANTLQQAMKLSPDSTWFSRFAQPLFQRYLDDTVAHFDYEEQSLFPYALSLAKGMAKDSAYSADKFLACHPHSDIDLHKVIAILSSKEASFGDNIAYRILIKRLQHLEEDMHLHSLIEDEVLVIKLKNLEIARPEQIGLN